MKPFVQLFIRFLRLLTGSRVILQILKFIGLVNILAEKEIVPELLQNDFTVLKKSPQTAVRLLQDKDYRERMISELEINPGKTR